MQIRRYDEVDPFEVYELTLAAFGRGLSEDWVRLARRRDPRVLDGYAIYAVERGRPIAQVIPLRMPVRLTKGPEEVGAIAGVCAHPRVWGRGYAHRLMERTHEIYRELGLRIATLATSRNLRGYGLYQRMGYVDLAPFFRASRALPAKRFQPRRYRLRTATRKDLARIQVLFETYTRDLFGWTLRSPELLPLYVRWNRKELDAYRVLANNGVAVGYARVAPGPYDIAEEVIAPRVRDFRALVALLVAKARRRVVTMGYFTAKRDRERFAAAGYEVCGPLPFATMAVPLDRRVRARDLPALFGATRERFVHYITDDF